MNLTIAKCPQAIVNGSFAVANGLLVVAYEPKAIAKRDLARAKCIYAIANETFAMAKTSKSATALLP